jgi:hypothetical protein
VFIPAWKGSLFDRPKGFTSQCPGTLAGGLVVLSSFSQTGGVLMRFFTARPRSWWPLTAALLAGLLCVVPAGAGSDQVSAPTAAAVAPGNTVVPGAEAILDLNDWEYTDNGGGGTAAAVANTQLGLAMGQQLTERQVLVDIILFKLWVDLNTQGKKFVTTTTSSTGAVSTQQNQSAQQRFMGILFVEFIYDLSVADKLTTQQLDFLVFGEYFLNQMFVVPELGGTTS